MVSRERRAEYTKQQHHHHEPTTTPLTETVIVEPRDFAQVGPGAGAEKPEHRLIDKALGDGAVERLNVLYERFVVLRAPLRAGQLVGQGELAAAGDQPVAAQVAFLDLGLVVPRLTGHLRGEQRVAHAVASAAACPGPRAHERGEHFTARVFDCLREPGVVLGLDRGDGRDDGGGLHKEVQQLPGEDVATEEDCRAKARLEGDLEADAAAELGAHRGAIGQPGAGVELDVELSVARAWAYEGRSVVPIVVGLDKTLEEVKAGRAVIEPEITAPADEGLAGRHQNPCVKVLGGAAHGLLPTAVNLRLGDVIADVKLLQDDVAAQAVPVAQGVRPVRLFGLVGVPMFGDLQYE